MNHNADAYATMQQGDSACRAHDRPLAATQTPMATNPGGASLHTQ